MNIRKLILFSLLLIGFYSARLGASDHFDRIEIESLEGARSNEQLSEKLNLIDELRIKEGACALQLKSKRLPYACFDLKVLVENSPSEIRNEIKALVSQDQNELNRVCRQTAEVTREAVIISPNHLPKDCIKIAVARIRVNRYKLGKVFDNN